MSNKEVVLHLLQAKKHSDRGEYEKKKAIIRHLVSQTPSKFIIDSRQTHTVGLTHKPSGFKIHTLKSSLSVEFLYKRAQLLEAFYKL